MPYKEDPAKQRSISLAVSLNNAVLRWQGDTNRTDKEILETADTFYKYLTKIEPISEQDKQVIAEVTEHLSKPTLAINIPPKPNPTPPPAQTHINCTQCSSIVEVGQECPRCKETGNPWHSDKAKKK